MCMVNGTELHVYLCLHAERQIESQAWNSFFLTVIAKASEYLGILWCSGM